MTGEDESRMSKSHLLVDFGVNSSSPFEAVARRTHAFSSPPALLRISDDVLFRVAILLVASFDTPDNACGSLSADSLDGIFCRLVSDTLRTSWHFSLDVI